MGKLQKSIFNILYVLLYINIKIPDSENSQVAKSLFFPITKKDPCKLGSLLWQQMFLICDWQMYGTLHSSRHYFNQA